MGPVQRATASQLESALLTGMTKTRTPVVGIETTDTEPSSISFFKSNDLSTVDDVELTAGKLAMVFAMLGTEGSFGVKGSADRLLPDLLGTGRLRLALGRVPAGDRAGAAAAAGGRARAARRRPGAGELPRRRGSPSRSGRCWRRWRWSRWRRWPSSTTAPTSTCSTPNCGAGCPTCSGSPSSASSTTRSGRGRRRRRAARLARALAGAARRQPLDRRDQGDRGAGAGRLRGLRARPRILALRSPTSRC